jgi:hypothetical protein
MLLGDGDVLITGGWNGHRADAADDPPWDPSDSSNCDRVCGGRDL